MKLIALLALAGTALVHASPIAGGPCVSDGGIIDYSTLAKYVALGDEGCFLSQIGQAVRIYNIDVALPDLSGPDLSIYWVAAFNGGVSPDDPPIISWPGFVVRGAPFTALPVGTVFNLSWESSVPTRANGGEYDWHLGLPSASFPDSTAGTITATMTADFPVLVLIELTGENAPGLGAPLTNAPDLGASLTDAPEPSALLPLLGIGLLLIARYGVRKSSSR